MNRNIKSMMRDTDGIARKGTVLAKRREKEGRKVKDDLRKMRQEYRTVKS